MTTPTAAQIKQMNGQALTKLAWEYGLHPFTGSSCTYEEMCLTTPAPWHPHCNLVQADAVFRALRCHGWLTHNDSAADYGSVRALRWAPDGTWLCQSADWDTSGQSEAMALLRCACLAMASVHEDEHPA